jgi:hypothetical protein
MKCPLNRVPPRGGGEVTRAILQSVVLFGNCRCGVSTLLARNSERDRKTARLLLKFVVLDFVWYPLAHFRHGSGRTRRTSSFSSSGQDLSKVSLATDRTVGFVVFGSGESACLQPGLGQNTRRLEHIAPGWRMEYSARADQDPARAVSGVSACD